MTSKILAVAALSLVAGASFADGYAFGYSGGAPVSLTVYYTGGGSYTTDTSVSQFTSGVMNQGWYSDVATSDDTNDNYIVGSVGATNYRDYFTFDLSGVTGTVAGAILTLSTYDVSGNGTLYLYDVSTDAATLNLSNGTFDAGIFNDLGSGVGYGGFTLSDSEDYISKGLVLDFNAVTAINATNGGFFSVGGRYVESEAVPEPASMAVLGLGALGLLRRRRNAKRS